MIIRNRAIAISVVAFTLTLILVIAFHFSKIYFVKKYLAEREVWADASYPIPYTSLYWSLVDVTISDNMHENGRKLSAFKEGISNSDIPDFVNAENGVLNNRMCLITVIVEVGTKNGEASECTPEELRLPTDFLKLENIADISSFINATAPIAVNSRADYDNDGSISIAKNSKELITLTFLLDDASSINNAYLFTNVIPTQTVSVCIPMKNYI